MSKVNVTKTHGLKYSILKRYWNFKHRTKVNEEETLESEMDDNTDEQLTGAEEAHEENPND